MLPAGSAFEIAHNFFLFANFIKLCAWRAQGVNIFVKQSLERGADNTFKAEMRKPHKSTHNPSCEAKPLTT